MFRLRLARLVPDLSAAIDDFPVPCLVSIGLFTYVQLDIGGVAEDGATTGNQVYLAGTASFIAAGAAHQFARARSWARSPERGLALVAGLAAAIIAYFERITGVSHLFLIPGLAILLLIAGFLRSDAKQASLWVANLRLAIAFAIASIVGIAFASGISAILASLAYLFEFELPNDAHDRVWATAMTLISPLYGLSLAPRDLAEEIDVDDPPDRQVAKGVSSLVFYVLAPLVLVFAAILHAYAVKIAIEGELPRNQLGSMVTAFALIGTATWLIAWPWRERGPSWLRFFMGGWFWLTIVPTILLAVAIVERIRAFGVTPDRYGVAVVAVWLALVATYLARRRGLADMRVLLGSLALLLLVGSAGPFGAFGVTASDQYRRLLDLLAKNGAIAGAGQFVPPASAFPSEVEERIGTILESLNGVHALPRLRPLFAGREEDPFRDGKSSGWDVVHAVAKAMDVELQHGSATVFSFDSGPIVHAVRSDSRLVGPIELGPHTPRRQYGGVVVGLSGDGIEIERDGVVRPIPAVRLREHALASTTQQASALVVSVDDSLTAVVTRAFGDDHDTGKIMSVTFWLIVEGREGAAAEPIVRP